MNLGFGLDRSAYDFGGYEEDPSETETGGDPYLERALRAAKAQRLIKEQMPEDPPPENVNIPRINNEAQAPGLWQRHPGAAKGIDIAALLTRMLQERNVGRKNNAAIRTGSSTRYRMPAHGDTPLLTPQVRALNAVQAKNSQDIQEQNSRIAEAESRINTNAMSRYATRQTAQLGQMVPSITKAMMREPTKPRVSPSQQRLDAVRSTMAWKAASQDERNKIELRALGADAPRDPQTVADVYAKAQANFMGRYDAQKKVGQLPAGSDPTEKNLAIVFRAMQEDVESNFATPEEAATHAIALLGSLDTVRAASGRPTLMPPAVTPPPASGLPPGVPASPAGGSYQQPVTTPGHGAQLRGAAMQGLPTDLAERLNVYAKRISSHPEDRAHLRAALMQQYGIDPDLYLETGR